MMVRLLIILVGLLSSVTSKAETVCIQNVPQYGDQTCTTTTDVVTSVITNHTTNNFLSGDFTDGTWNGPNLDHTHGSGTIAGVGGEYVQSTLTQADSGLSDDEVQRGFSSTIGADIWFWDSSDTKQSVTMTQTFNDGNGDTTTQSRVVDYANNGFTTYQDTIVIGENNISNGSVTARFDFTHTNTQYHRAADLKNPTLTFDYTKIENTISQVSNTSIEYCWERTPNTCPQAVKDIGETIVNIEDDLQYIFEYFKEPELELPVIIYEPKIIEVEEPQIEIEILSIETIDMVPDVETIEVLSIPVEMSMVEDTPIEEFTTEEIIDAYDPEPIVETRATPEPEAPEPEADPIEITEQVDEPVEEQPSSEDVVTEQPIQETDNPQQEEIVEAEVEEERPEPTDEPMEEDIAEVVEEEPEVVEEEKEVSVDIVAVEKYIDGKVQSQIEKIEATLVVVNELVSRAMISNQVDISSYATKNNAIFDNRQLADGNPDFFNQISLVSYNKTIYNDPTKLIAMIGVDPVVVHKQKVNNARNKTNEAYFILKALMEAQNVQ
jgi:hypothetical protein